MKILKNFFGYFFSILFGIIGIFGVYLAIRRTAYSPVAYLSGAAAALLLGAFIFFVIKTLEKDRISARGVLFLSLGAAFFVRLLFLLNVHTAPVSDFKTMFEAAVLAGKGDFSNFTLGTYFHRFSHLTCFPLLCSLVFRFGGNLFTVKVINMLLSVSGTYIIYLILKEMRGEKAGAAAALIYAFFLPSITYITVFASENFAISLFMLSFLELIKSYKSESTKNVCIHAALSGLFVACGCLMRGVSPFYISAYAVGILTVFYKHRKLLALLCLTAAFMIVTKGVGFALFESGITEYKLGERQVPFTMFMLTGFNFETHGMYSPEDQAVYYEAGGDTEEMERIINRRISERIRENAAKLPEHFCRKTYIAFCDGDFGGVYWSCENGENKSGFTCGFMRSYANIFYIILLFLCAAVFFKTRGKNMFCMGALLLLAFWGGLMLMEVQPRYPFAAAYMFVILAAYSLPHKMPEN